MLSHYRIPSGAFGGVRLNRRLPGISMNELIVALEESARIIEDEILLNNSVEAGGYHLGSS